MKTTSRSCKGAALALLLYGATASSNPTMDQPIELSPGWNAVYLEVEPEDKDPAAVFANLPAGLTLESAWTWDSGAPVEFIRNPGEGLQAQEGWRAYYNPADPNDANDPKVFLTDLHAIVGNRAYLLKLSGGAPATWTLNGRPSLRDTLWTSDSFNLRGFSVDPLDPPTFTQYFAPSPAHTGQSVYRLLTSGQWQRVDSPSTTDIQSGQAYYVYSSGGSSYAGPLEVEPDQGDGLSFGKEGNDFQIRMRNLHSTAGTVSLGLVPSSGTVPLAYFLLETSVDPNEPTAKQSWPDLPSTLSRPAPSGKDVYVRLAVDRKEIVSDPAESVMQITDGRGSRRLLPVTAELPSGSLRRGAVLTVPPGLWVGTVRLDSVNQAQLDANDPNSTVTTPATADTSFRILLHADGDGQVRLLRSVIMMWEDGVLIPDPNNPGTNILGTPGHYVLLTDDSLIPSFSGAVLRDGEPVGYRISAVTYDFDEPASAPGQVKNTLKLTGSLDVAETITGTLTMGPNNPTNPFLHKFHPDHDNRSPLGAPLPSGQEEAFGFSRALTLTVASSDPLSVNGADRYDWGVTRLEGTYRDTITGVHKNDVIVGGTFTLQHVSSIAVLNQ